MVILELHNIFFFDFFPKILKKYFELILFFLSTDLFKAIFVLLNISSFEIFFTAIIDLWYNFLFLISGKVGKAFSLPKIFSIYLIFLTKILNSSGSHDTF